MAPSRETLLALGIAIAAISFTYCSITKKNPLMLLCPITYTNMFSSSSSSTPRPENMGELPARKFTTSELAQYDGTDPTHILVAVKGNVYRVSPQYYGKGQSYNCFAGTDCSRNLGKGIIGKDEANADWRTLNDDHMSVLNSWEKRFQEKYVIVGTIVEDEEFMRRGKEFSSS